MLDTVKWVPITYEAFMIIAGGKEVSSKGKL